MGECGKERTGEWPHRWYRGLCVAVEAESGVAAAVIASRDLPAIFLRLSIQSDPYMCKLHFNVGSVCLFNCVCAEMDGCNGLGYSVGDSSTSG